MKPYHTAIVLDPRAEAVVQTPRAVPVHLHKMFKVEQDRKSCQMVELSVIVPVKEPTEWVNNEYRKLWPGGI